MRLLVSTSTWPLFAGDQRTPFVRNLTHDLSSLGWNILVSAPHAPGAALQEQDGRIAISRFRYAPEHLETLAYGSGGLTNLKSFKNKLLTFPFVCAQVAHLVKAIRDFRPDVIHAHWALPQGFAAAVARQLAGPSIPLVTTVHGGDIFGLRSRAFRPFKRYALSAAAEITVNSAATGREAALYGASTGRLTTIHMPPASETEPLPEAVAAWRSQFWQDEFLALFVGRLIPEKGAADLIKAVAAAKDRRLRAVIVGDGPQRFELVYLAQSLGILDQVIFEGWLSPEEVAIRMAGSDLYVGPSKRSSSGWVEAQGIVFLEAMRAGIPVIGSISGGIPDILDHGNRGWLFNEGDVEAITRLIEQAASRRLPDFEHIVTEASRFAADVNRTSTAAQFNNLFRRCLHDHEC